MKAHVEILVGRQRKALAAIAPLAAEAGFYLAGGTAVALRFGHRRSVDLDWFTAATLPDPLLLARRLQDTLPFQPVTLARGTLYGQLYGVRMSFIEYRYPLLEPVDRWADGACDLASPRDLACMKLSAIAQRGAKKDFVDLYVLGVEGQLTLSDMLAAYREKYGVQDIAHVLYALTYFDDAQRERIPPMLWPVRWPAIRETIQGWAREVA